MAQKDRGIGKSLSKATTDEQNERQEPSCLSATMRHAFILTLFCILQIPVLAQTKHSLPQPRQAQGPDLSTNSASVRDWANRLMARDAKVRATAEATLVQAAPRSLPLLRRFLSPRQRRPACGDF